MIHFMFITLLPPYVVPTYSYVTNVFVYNLHITVCARMYSTAQKQCTRKWSKKFLRRKNTQVAARSKNVLFLRFTRKNIRNARS